MNLLIWQPMSSPGMHLAFAIARAWGNGLIKTTAKGIPDMKVFASGVLLGVLCLVSATSQANLITNGDFESAGLNTTNTSINGSSGPFGEWLALSGHWTISSGEAANTTDYAENPDYNYILMQGVDLSGYSSPFAAELSFDYAYEGGFGGIDGRGVRVFGMDSGDVVQIFFSGTTFDQVTDDLLLSQILTTTGNPTTAFSAFESGVFMVDPTQYSSLLVVFTFGGDPSSEYLRAVDNVSLSVPEPGTLTLLGLGLVGLGFAKRRKNT